MKYLGPVGTLVGVVVVIVGAMLQTYGAAAVVFCSVIGAGIVLTLVAIGFWLYRALRTHRPSPLAA